MTAVGFPVMWFVAGRTGSEMKPGGRRRRGRWERALLPQTMNSHCLRNWPEYGAGALAFVPGDDAAGDEAGHLDGELQRAELAVVDEQAEDGAGA